MMRRAVLAYGGVDVLVASAGPRHERARHRDDAGRVGEEPRRPRRAATSWRRARPSACSSPQGRGGSIVFVGSKNALVAGANASAYSSAKAASLHLARCLAEEGGEHGIRVNTVNPDAVIEGSGDLVVGVEGRAREHLRRRRGGPARLLPRPHRRSASTSTPEDVAEAIVFLASARSAKSTGNVINVDGGVAAAYPR